MGRKPLAAGYRCDRQVADVEALRHHLGLDRVDALAHSAAGDLALLHAARHPARTRTLTLVTARARALGIDYTHEHRPDRRRVPRPSRSAPAAAGPGERTDEAAEGLAQASARRGASPSDGALSAHFRVNGSRGARRGGRAVEPKG
ncbi:alpha/beta fold hydrolase [Streptomyces kronopolitis]|uniref:alpha/beta fold hydrolase n=1 Tax=Streptomyces kronopolitis TaxID=1612435 RepID=UPI003D99FE21